MTGLIYFYVSRPFNQLLPDYNDTKHKSFCIEWKLRQPSLFAFPKYRAEFQMQQYSRLRLPTKPQTDSARVRIIDGAKIRHWCKNSPDCGSVRLLSTNFIFSAARHPDGRKICPSTNLRKVFARPHHAPKAARDVVFWRVIARRDLNYLKKIVGKPKNKHRL